MGILIALPIAAAIAILDRRKIEEFLFLAIGIIVLLIIVSGMGMNNTMPGVYAAMVLGGIAFFYCLVMTVKDRERVRRYVLTPGLAGGLLCIVAAAFMFLGRNDLGSNEDTFRTHAAQIINMYQNSVKA